MLFVSYSSCYLQEETRQGKAAEFRPNILMLGHSPSDFILRALSSVHTNDLEQTLLVRERLNAYII